MKRGLFLAVSSLSLLTLVACGDTATPIDGTDKTSDLTLEQVFDKAIERQQSVKSVQADVDMDQSSELTIEGQKIEVATSSDLQMKVHQNPLAMYTKGTVEMNMGDENTKIPLEMYMTEADGFYMYNSDADEWLKLPEEQQQQILAQTGAQADASKQLEQLKEFVNDFTFEQDNKDYKLILNVEGDKFKEFIMSQLGSTVADTSGVTDEILTGLTFEDSKYEIIIEKDTFNTKEIDMDITIIIDMEGQQTKIDNDAKIVYSNYDKVEEISVPTEVKNKAISQ